jgi:hypothetical protein
VTVLVWNATIANLLLLALGSSAPNIMLVIIDTATSLGSPSGIIGPSSIIGAPAIEVTLTSTSCLRGS